ncbi:unnamed protein product [Ophioblennius macclurei]
MAAPCVTVFRTALKGLHLVPGRWFLSQSNHRRAACHRAMVHVSSAAPMCSNSTDPRRSAGGEQQQKKEEKKKDDEEEEEDEGPEYIPRRKAKNPMMKIGYAWMIGLPTGIIGFLLAKRQVDKNRLKQLKIRQRMRRSNEGQYEGSRYRHHADDVKLER